MNDLDAVLDRLAELVAEKLATKVHANGNGHGVEVPDKLLTAPEAAKLLGVRVRWLYAHKLPFTVRLPGSRAVRFSAAGLEQWIAKRQSNNQRGGN